MVKRVIKVFDIDIIKVRNENIVGSWGVPDVVNRVKKSINRVFFSISG